MEALTKVCKCCGKGYTLDHFKKGRWGYVSVCNECDTKHRKEKREKRLEEEKESKERELANCRKLNLQDFTPRELMQELARRGYRGKLEYVETRTIDLSAF